MPTIFLDIETVPSGPKPTIDQLKPPGQMKKADTIMAWRKDIVARTEELEEIYRKRALSYVEGRILCIGYAINTGPVKGIINDDEEALIAEFQEALRGEDDAIYKRTCTLVGHNSLSFDFPYLFLRSAKYGQKDLMSLFGAARECFKDTMKMFSLTDRANYISMARACAFFSITGVKDDMDGSMVYDEYLKGNGQGILEYCMRDVHNLRQLYQKLTQADIVSL